MEQNVTKEQWLKYELESEKNTAVIYNNGESRIGILTTDNRIKPLQDNIVLEMIDEERTTNSGIVLPAGELAQHGDDLPDKYKGKPLYGRVVAKGPGTYNKKGVFIPVDSSIELGSIVYTNFRGGTPIVIEDKKYMVYREFEILFISDKQY